MPPEVQANETEARTPTGEIKDSATILGSDTTTTPSETSSEAETVLTEKPVEPAKEPAKAVVPEKYEFSAPENWKENGWELDSATLDRATPLFKELGLTNEQAQKLVSFYATESQKDHEATLNLAIEQNKKWRSEISAHPELGKNLNEVKSTVSAALDTLGPKAAGEFKAALDLTGAGNHPAIVYGLWKIAQAFSEGGHVAGRGPSTLGQSNPKVPLPSAAHALYPNNP